MHLLDAQSELTLALYVSMMFSILLMNVFGDLQKIPFLLVASSTLVVLFLAIFGLIRLLGGVMLMRLSIFALAIFLPMILYIVLLGALLWSKDWVRWRGWVRSHPASMTGQEFLETIAQYRFSTSCIRPIRFVREQGLLVATEETETLLKKLALGVEQDMIIVKGETTNKMLTLAAKRIIGRLSRTQSKGNEDRSPKQAKGTSSESDFFELWLTEYTRKNKKRLAGLGAEFLDELCMLLEQMRATRRDIR
jgi:hypothetical protein